MRKIGTAGLCLAALLLALAGCGSSHNSSDYWRKVTKHVGSDR